MNAECKGKMFIFIAELRGAPYPYSEIKETHELIFSCYRGQRYFSWARTHDDYILVNENEVILL